MKKQHDQEPEQVVSLRLWSLPDVHKVVPYVRSLMQSLREGWLNLRQAQERLQRAKAHPGRPKREQFIQMEESQRDAERAEAALQEIVEEMMTLSAYCVDPVSGLAVIPFLRGQELAWYVFDLFDEQGIIAWRLYSDPLETRRPLAELELSQAGGAPQAPADSTHENVLLPRPPAPGFENLN